MTNKRGAWISRRGQADAEAAIDLVIERQPQPGEEIQQIADTLIEDSPYQARKPFSDASVEDLAQGMRASGFHGVLIARPRADGGKQRDGFFQLVYGHRRRAAWRRVCAEQGINCILPVVVRHVSDEQMLTIGAQENLQRQDLDPVEEAQLVVWHERMFTQKNQAEIGAMLGKSSDWISLRSRIHRLPDELKERLRDRPRAISQMLELSGLYKDQQKLAVELADRVVDEGLTLDGLRSIIRGYARPERRGAATSVKNITSQSENSRQKLGCEERNDYRGTATNNSTGQKASMSDNVNVAIDTPPVDTISPDDVHLLEQSAASLTLLASRAQSLPSSRRTLQALHQAEDALKQLRHALAQQAEEYDL